ncbi:sulfurtransferase-like selenium metabolism protein YedF [Candidatus Poribacteria bacterium]|nr:sulfurtransferase-like selenium metabolism protein YedF [Candidatus Poribacteria bacterium]
MKKHNGDKTLNKILDARGWACPKPVLETKKMLQNTNEFTVIVDNKAARENVSRLAVKSGCEVEVEEKGDGIYLHLKKESESIETEQDNEVEEYISCENGNIVLFIASDKVGSGSDELGGILIRAFMHTFLEVNPKPNIIILLNGGVKLATKDSPVQEDLKNLSRTGVKILVCGTCLNYFQLMNEVAVGEVSNAYTIAETLLQAGKVVKF